MSGMTPYAQLIGPAKMYVAPAGTVIPALDAAPGGAWIELGPTEGDQSITVGGGLEYWSDNNGTSEVTARRPETTVMATFTVVGLTQENVARILHSAANVTTGTSGALAVKEVGFERPYVPTEYALLMRGETDSPYGLWPAQTYLPRGSFDGDFEMTKGKNTRAEVECEFHALRDESQAVGKQLGWSQARSS